MSFILVPTKGEDLQVNSWNWRPTLELLFAAKAITAEEHEFMGYSGWGGTVSKERAEQIADVVTERLMSMNHGERVRADLSVTKDPKKLAVFSPDMNTDDIDVPDLYSATYEWLETFARFCRSSDGFEVV